MHVRMRFIRVQHHRISVFESPFIRCKLAHRLRHLGRWRTRRHGKDEVVDQLGRAARNVDRTPGLIPKILKVQIPILRERLLVLMAVEIRVFPAIDAVLQISGTVLALEVKLFLLLAKQTLDSARHAFGDDFADYPMASASITRSRREARFLTAKIERIPEAANNFPR